MLLSTPPKRLPKNVVERLPRHSVIFVDAPSLFLGRRQRHAPSDVADASGRLFHRVPSPLQLFFGGFLFQPREFQRLLSRFFLLSLSTFLAGEARFTRLLLLRLNFVFEIFEFGEGPFDRRQRFSGYSCVFFHFANVLFHIFREKRIEFVRNDVADVKNHRQ